MVGVAGLEHQPNAVGVERSGPRFGAGPPAMPLHAYQPSPFTCQVGAAGGQRLPQVTLCAAAGWTQSSIWTVRRP